MVSVCFLEDVTGFLVGYLGVNPLEEVEKVLVGYFVLLCSKTHSIHHLSKVQILLTDVEPQLVQDGLHLILEHRAVRQPEEISLEDRMSKDLVPRDAIRLLQL